MQLELPRDNEILLRREFAASKAHVYLAITTPELVRRWRAPRSRGEMTHCTIDLRVGGRWRYEMRTTTGFVVGFSGEYLEIDGPDRVVCTEVFDLAPDFPSMVTSTLEERGGRTTLTVRSVYPSREIRDQVLATGMEHGARESYDQLAEVAGSLG